MRRRSIGWPSGGEKPGFKVAGASRFKPSDLDEWIDLREKVAADQAVEGDKA